MAAAKWPRENIRKIHPGSATPDDTDPTWRPVLPSTDPDPDATKFIANAGGSTTEWGNYTAPSGGVPWAPMQFRLRDDGMVDVEGWLTFLEQPIGRFGSPVLIFPTGYGPQAKETSADGNFAVWPFDAPTSIDQTLPRTLVWIGPSPVGGAIYRTHCQLSFLAGG